MVTNALLGVITEAGFTQIVVGAIATFGAIVAALANTRGRKQEAATSNMEMNIDANNRLVDQLQETIDTQSEENNRLREHIERLDKRVAELETHLQRSQKERSRLAIENGSLKTRLADEAGGDNTFGV